MVVAPLGVKHQYRLNISLVDFTDCLGPSDLTVQFEWAIDADDKFVLGVEDR